MNSHMFHDVIHVVPQGWETVNKVMYIHNEFGHPNRIIGSQVAAILLKGWILPIGGTASGRVCACSLRRRLIIFNRPVVARAVLLDKGPSTK